MAITTLKSTRDIARIWFFWKIPAIIAFCLIVFFICLYSFTQTPVYETTAKVLLLPKTNDELVVSAGQGRGQYDIQRIRPADVNTEVELLKSAEVLTRTLSFFQENPVPPDMENDGNKEDTPSGTENGKSSDYLGFEKEVNRLRGQLVVEPVYSSNIISVSLSSTNQYEVADVLNKMIEIYIAFHKEMYSKKESESFYDGQKQYYGKQLNEARERLKEFNQNNDITNLQGQIAANIALISNFNGELQNLEVAIAANDAKIKMLEKGIKIHGNKIILSREMRNLPVIAELAKGLVPLLIKRTEISKTFTKQSREYKQIDDQIAMLRNEIKNEIEGAAWSNSIEMEALRAKKEELAKRVAFLNEKNKNIDQKQQALSALELDVQIAKKNYLLYGTKTEDSRLYSMRNKTNLSNVVIVESADIPTSAKSPNKMLALQVSVILGLFTAFVLPFIIETMDHKIKTIDDIEQVLDMKVVCTYNEV